MDRLRRANRIGQSHGQSLVEVLVVTLILIGIFALPLGGQPSLASLFTDAIGAGYGRFLSALSLPL